MFGIGFPELIVILIILLLVFGAKRLPEIGAAIGKAISEFKKSSENTQKDDKSEKSE